MRINGREMNRAQVWGIAALATVIAIVVCYFFLDRPFALFAHTYLRPARFAYFDFFDLLTLIPEPIPVIAAVIFAALGIRALTGRALPRPFEVALVLSVTALCTTMINRQLKFAFGRTWPETWTGSNPSFIQDGVYGFFPFHGGAGYAALPSGHMAAICAVATILWLCYPRLQPLYVFVVALVLVGLLGANYHFLSDIIAGVFVGVSMGWFAIALWGAELRPPPRAPKRTRRK
jgi:membrane-associated phospholipid phosphatase